MYKIALCTTVMLAIATPAYSQDSDERTDDELGITTTDLRLREGQQQRLLGQLFMSPVYFLLWDAIHEGSHALMGVALGREIVRFRPFPHNENWTDDKGEEQSRFYFGSVSFWVSNDEDPWRAALISIAPIITDVLVFTASDLALQYGVDQHSVAAPFLLGGGMVAPMIDMMVSLNCMSNTCDLSRFSEASGIPRSAIMVVGYAMMFTALWRCLHQFRRLFMEHRPKPNRRSLAVSVALLQDSEYVGAGINGVF